VVTTKSGKKLKGKTFDSTAPVMRVQTAAADSVQAAEEEQPAPPQQKPVYEVKTTSMSAAPLRYLPVPVYILVRKDFT
jgi:hypothetical protein